MCIRIPWQVGLEAVTSLLRKMSDYILFIYAVSICIQIKQFVLEVITYYEARKRSVKCLLYQLKENLSLLVL